MPQLDRFVGEVLSTRTTQQWSDALAAADIPFASVNSMADLMFDPHLVATGFWREVMHPTEGRLMQPGSRSISAGRRARSGGTRRRSVSTRRRCWAS